MPEPETDKVLGVHYIWQGLHKQRQLLTKETNNASSTRRSMLKKQHTRGEPVYVVGKDFVHNVALHLASKHGLPVKSVACHQKGKK